MSLDLLWLAVVFLVAAAVLAFFGFVREVRGFGTLAKVLAGVYVALAVAVLFL